jgi:hypothetical protein
MTTSTTIVPGPRPTLRRATGLLVASVALVGLTGAPAAGAVPPDPAPGQVPGVAWTLVGPDQGSGTEVFYRAATDRLVLLGDARIVDLGGVLTSGPAGIGVLTSTGGFLEKQVVARGADGAVWSRRASGDADAWGPWSSLGGRAVGAPTVSCVQEPAALPRIYVRGTDDALWRLHDDRWTRLGGRLSSAPSALPATHGACPTREAVLALGTDGAVWEWSGGSWHAVGGRSASAPAVLERSAGQTDAFVRGLDNALWANTRTAGASGWQGWRRIGGVLSGPPTATDFPTEPAIRGVFALGGDGELWEGSNVVGTPTWNWSRRT